MRITSKGQVTIPQALRVEFGLLPDEVEFIAKRGVLQIVKSTNPTRSTRGQAVVSRLRGRATVKMSTDEILALTRK
jgi:bifunctional DNA-binding transcriptional regulator/antitoxin component of YhaV-PrlF toxin-antitoxin module